MERNLANCFDLGPKLRPGSVRHIEQAALRRTDGRTDGAPQKVGRRRKGSGLGFVCVLKSNPSTRCCCQTMAVGMEGRYLEEEVLVEAPALAAPGLGFLMVAKVVTEGAGLSLVHTLPWTKALDGRSAAA